MTEDFSSLEINMGEGLSSTCTVLGIMGRSALGIGGKTRIFRASVFSGRVVGVPDGLARVGIARGLGRGETNIGHLTTSDVRLGCGLVLTHCDSQ